MEIITVTGTKGKTTVVRVLSAVLHKMGRDTLRVDTDGHYVNEKQKSDLAFSKNMFGNTVPTVAPGKYLLAMSRYYPDFTAVLESALGSRSAAGLGYGRHDVGIFTNIFEDHLGVSKSLQTRADLAEAKKFVFTKITTGGYAVFNADDKYVCSKLHLIKPEKKITLIPVGITFGEFDIKSHKKAGGKYITYKDGYIILAEGKKERRLLRASVVPWTFNGEYMPSVWNLMFVIGGLFAYGKGHVPKGAIEVLENISLASSGGRLTQLTSSDGINIIVDYAHEKYSLIEISNLARKLALGHETIGVVRLAPDRTNIMIEETGRAIANRFDDIVVYDKIDGVTRKHFYSKSGKFDRKKGEVSNILFKAIVDSKNKGTVKRFLVEFDAISYASKLAHPGDVVIVICGDDHQKTVDAIKKYFKFNCAGSKNEKA